MVNEDFVVAMRMYEVGEFFAFLSIFFTGWMCFSCLCTIEKLANKKILLFFDRVQVELSW